jgi:hypothetical protein
MRALRFAFLAATVLTVPALALAAPHRAPQHHPVKRVVHADPGFTVSMDEARIITFPQPVATVFIGNPTIADITVIDSRHAYLLGKTFGVTNMIGLDIDHNQVMNRQVAVTNRNGGEVTLHRGADSYNYTCSASRCETGPRPGDPMAYVSNTEDTAAKHTDMGLKAAAASMPAGNNNGGGAPQ